MPKNEVVSNVSPAYLAGLLGTGITSVEPVYGGKNSRTYKATAKNGSKFVAKLYLGPTADGNSRLTAEFLSLEFLHQKGVDCVPRPVVADHNCQCAVYEFVEGEKVASEKATAADIDEMTRFLLRLQQLKDDPEAIRLPKAAEACFSIGAIVRNLEDRLGRLRAVDASSPGAGLLEDFLDAQFDPAFKETVAWCQQRATGAGVSMESELKLEFRTLSPSDFGFHNCLRRDNGQLVFLDFEYFGWDDPAKLVCDFLLHPAMELASSLKQRFVDNMVGTDNRDLALLERTETVYPLFALKWCLILLNPFLSEYRRQRGIADAPKQNRIGELTNQLEKAKVMLGAVEGASDRFPYRGTRDAVNVN